MGTNLPTDQPDVLDRLRAVEPGNLPSEIAELLEDAKQEIAGLLGENASLRRQLFGTQS